MKKFALLPLAVLAFTAACDDSSKAGLLAPEGPNFDNIVSAGGSLDATTSAMSLTAGGANGTTTLSVLATGGDGKNGCNLTGGKSATFAVSSSDANVATVSPSSVTFNNCGETKTLSVTPVAQGSANIRLTETANNTNASFDPAGAGFTVNVAAARPSDTTAPVITPSIDGTRGNNGWYKSNVTLTWSVRDDESAVTQETNCGAVSITEDQNATTYTCTATSAGGTASETVTIKRDATAPTLAPSVSPNPVLLNGSATVTSGENDNLSGVASSICGDVITSSVGSKSVSCTVTDNAGNTASFPASYSVHYDFAGFFKPIETDKLNRAKAGSAIPVKFSLGGDQGLNVFATGGPSPATIGCTTGEETIQVEGTVTAGSSSLQYDAVTGQYTYVWKTDAKWAGSCRQLRVTLNDGTLVKTVNFQLTK